MKTMEQDCRKVRFPGHGMFTGIKEQCEGLRSTHGRARSSLCLQNSNLSCSVPKVKFFIYNSTLFFLSFGKSFGKGKLHENRNGSNYVWFFLDDYREFHGMTEYKLYELIRKTKRVKGFSKANKIANSKFDLLFFFFDI